VVSRLLSRREKDIFMSASWHGTSSPGGRVNLLDKTVV
jgi:hypothetical protein